MDKLCREELIICHKLQCSIIFTSLQPDSVNIDNFLYTKFLVSNITSSATSGGKDIRILRWGISSVILSQYLAVDVVYIYIVHVVHVSM